MVDKAANKLTQKSGGGPTATATATATAGGATATATANTGGPGAGENAVVYWAQQALNSATGQNMSGLGRAPGGAVGSFTTGLVEGLATGLSGSFAPSAPNPFDCFPPPTPGVQPSMLDVDSSGKVTTAGGYTIEALNQFEWKISGPDGSATRVWGDPHVETSGKTGGEKFDFKKDTTFVLPDGTKINVKCTPWTGNPNVTVTQSLEIIQGNDRVMVTDIDKGKGKTGKVSHEANPAASTIQTQQTLIAGQNVADWYFNEAEVTGNFNGPDNFTIGQNAINGQMESFLSGYTKDGPMTEAAWESGGLGHQYSSAELAAVLQKHGQLAQKGGVDTSMNQVLAMLPKLLQALTALIKLGSFNPYLPPAPQPPVTKPTEKPKPPTYDPAQHAKGLSDAFKAIGAMFIALGKFLEVLATFKPQTQIPVGAR
jgi:hypothetical protein